MDLRNPEEYIKLIFRLDKLLYDYQKLHVTRLDI